MYNVSIIVPLFNEEDNVIPLHQEVVEVCSKAGYQFEIILVDDGSTDATYKRALTCSPATVIKFRRNFGQTAAIDAGIKQAQYPYIITMDGDGQNDPSDIPMMIDYMIRNELDIVSGWRKNRKDSFLKKFISRGANLLRNIFIKDKIHDSGCSLKVYKKECFDGITLYGEMHRFIPALLKHSGFTIGEIVVNHRPRTKGKTKYNFSRTIKGFVDIISVAFYSRFSVRPMHLLGGLGLILILLSAITGLLSVYYYLLGFGMSDTALPLLTVFLFLAGVQFFFTGIILDVQMKNHFETGQDKPYKIKEITKK